MTARRRVGLALCLALACLFFYAWSFVNDLLTDDRFHFLAEDALRTARDSVHEATRSLLVAYEDELRTTSERNVIDHLGTRLERLQASLDDLHQESSPGNSALEVLSGPRSVKGRRTRDADTHHIQTDTCGSLAGKRITMIGGEHIYRLHLQLLQHRERAERKSFPCPYHEFCTHHRICLPAQYFRNRNDTPPPRYIKPPTTQELVETESAVVNYVVSDTLLSARDESSWEYTLPFVDPTTGVRLRETYWLPAARKANVVILGRGPLSAPGHTYTGNWSFLRHLPDYVDIHKSGTAIAASELGYERQDDMHAPTYHNEPRSLEILNAAVHLTVSRFLPDVVQLLRSIRREVQPSKKKRLIWPSSWYRFPGRGISRSVLLRPRVHSKVRNTIRQIFVSRRRPWASSSAEHVIILQLSALINTDVMDTAVLEDPWTLFFNAQVYLQNMVLREILPRYGIVFLPLNEPWVCFRFPYGCATDIDLERTATVGEAFLRGIDRVLRYLE